MFIEYINDLTICGDEAAEVFPNIQKIFEHPDNSFLATLRAVLAKRMGLGETLSFGLKRYQINDDFHAMTPRKRVQSIAPAMRGCLIISSLEGNTRDVFDVVRTKAPDVYPSYKYLPEVSYYLSQHGGQKVVFVSTEDKAAMVIGSEISLPEWHYIQSVIPVLLPWHFAEPLSSDDSAILHALTKKSPQDYIAIMERLSMSLDLRVIKVRKMLEGLSQDYKLERISEAERKIQNLEHEIERLNQELSRKMTDKYESQITLCGLNNMEDSQDTELVEFFAMNKSLHIVSVGKGVVEYIATGYLNSFDQHIFEKYVKNKNSFFYKHAAGAKMTVEETIMLLKSIFMPDPKCKLRIYAAFELKLGGVLSPKRQYTYPAWLNTFFPHPHINQAGCLGGNLQYINQAMSEQDYVMAISQTMAAIRNINFADSVVIPPFIQKLQTMTTACIEMRTGEVVCPMEAVNLLKREEA